jgi:hypothetical protein
MSVFNTTNSISTIKSYFDRHDGLQLSNRFTVQFFNVPSFSGTPEIQALSVEMAPRTILNVKDGLQGYGQGRLVPRYQEFLSQGVIITFPITNDNYLFNFFNNWFNFFYSSNYASNTPTAGGFVLPYYDAAVANTSMQILLLDPNGNINTRMNFTEVFPVESLPFQLAMRSENSYMTYSVTFGFRDVKYLAT